MSEGPLEFYGRPGPMTELPARVAAAEVPSDLDALRGVVQGLLLHRCRLVGQ